MIIEVILIILGILTIILGIWNIIVEAYVWGAIFIIGGLWSLWLGIIYLRQIRRERSEQANTDSIQATNLSTELDEVFNNKTEDQILVDQTQEEEASEELAEFDKAVTFTNEVIPTPTINSEDLDNLDENSQITTELDDIDRNIEVIQNIAQNSPENTHALAIVEEVTAQIIMPEIDETIEEETHYELMIIPESDENGEK